MLVILNPAAGGGRALARWKRIESRVRVRAGDLTVARADSALGADALVVAGLAAGETSFVAAGGDGTVNRVMHALLRDAPPALRGRLALGAVGLGSSNDFHKPLAPGRLIDGVSCRLDAGAAVAHDVCRLVYRDPGGATACRYWLINASVGVTAEANRCFNDGGAWARLLKRLCPVGAMAYAALRGIATFGSREIALAVDQGEPARLRMRNLGIVKNPHFTGALRYDSPYEPASGSVHVHLLGAVSLPRLAVELWGLARGRFSGPRNLSWRARRVWLAADRPFAIEGDGEVVVACEAAIEVLPRCLRVCA